MLDDQRLDGVVDRRAFFALAGKRGLQFALAGMVAPSILAACSRALDPAVAPDGGPIVGDVLDYALTGEWQGAFGSVRLRLHRGVFEGRDLYYIRTDASDEAFAARESLVWVPKVAVLAERGPAADAYLIEGGVPEQATVVSTAPGRDDYTPAWRVHRARWTATPRALASVADVTAAEDAGELTIERDQTILNAPVVKWPGGQMPVDGELTGYLGPGQLVSAPDTGGMSVTFKLHECFPGVRYIVTDTALAPMAEGMNVVHSPALAGSSARGATGRTNVFMNGVEGSGPMGFQPSVFDSQAGSPEWSPYWDHLTYAWKRAARASVLRDEAAIHAARDDGRLEEFPGVPDTMGETFVVNCPVPVLAPNTV